MRLIKCNILRSQSSEKSINHCLAAAGVPGENTCFPSLSLTLFVFCMIIKPTRLVGPSSFGASQGGEGGRRRGGRRVTCRLPLAISFSINSSFSHALSPCTPLAPSKAPLAFPTHQQRQAQNQAKEDHQAVRLPLSRDQNNDAV